MDRIDAPHRTLRSALAAVCALVAALAATPRIAGAAVFDLQPGAEGEDTSAYAFIGSLVRGNYDTLYAQTADDEDGVSHDMITYLRFDLPPGLLQPGETVLGASLFMVFSFTFSHDGQPPPPGGELYVHEVTQGWDEQTLSWNNRPAHGALLDAETNIPAFGSIELDVTEAVRLWAHGLADNHGFAVLNPTDVPIGFHSWESVADPALKNHLVIVTGPGGPPATPVPALGPIGALGLASLVAAVGARRARAQSSMS